MRVWWRWTSRGIAIIALVVGGVLLALHPVARYDQYPPATKTISPALRLTCLSPFDRLTGTTLDYHGVIERLSPTILQAACAAATDERERVVDALGIGAVVFAGLSFLPRRRELATVRLEPSAV